MYQITITNTTTHRQSVINIIGLAACLNIVRRLRKSRRETLRVWDCTNKTFVI